MKEVEKRCRIHIRDRITTSRRSPLAHADHVWSTSVTVIVSYPAHRMTKQPTTLLYQPWRSHNVQLTSRHLQFWIDNAHRNAEL